MEADFSGFATKAGLKCSDGRTIMPDAFKHQDKMTVPLVWQHNKNTPANVLGHAVLEARDGHIYAHGYFNNTDAAKNARILVQHGDVESLSIWANDLSERNKQVFHGKIHEVSLVLSGANPGAKIDNVRIAHGEDDYTELEDEVFIYTGEPLIHTADPIKTDSEDVELEHDGKTLQDVYQSLDEDQKNLLHFLVGQAVENGGSLEQSADDDNEGAISHQEGNSEMNRNVFDINAAGSSDTPSLSHDQMVTIFNDAKKLGSFKQAWLAHAEDYGITNIELLFPEARSVDKLPEWITRRMEWVTTVLNGTRKIPWARIKSMSADLTHEEARAKGYIKATMKKDQYFTLSKRETGPKTIYKRQKIDRDDLIDVTDFDIVAWFWQEMRFMLNEEIARAILVGDGREVDDPDKIDEDKIRPIAHDDPFYTDVVVLASNASPTDVIEAVLRNRSKYKGSGQPVAFMTEALLSDMILLKDRNGRRLYDSEAELATAMRVRDIVTVDVLEDVQTDDGNLEIILVNLSDYGVGTDKGGEITTFDDFDIDYNQYKYLIEGRMSGALLKHKTAQVIVRADGTSVTPTTPTFNATSGVVTIPSVTGVVYKNQETDATLTAGAQTAIASGATISVEAVPATGYYFPHNIDADWDFTRD